MAGVIGGIANKAGLALRPGTPRSGIVMAATGVSMRTFLETYLGEDLPANRTGGGVQVHDIPLGRRRRGRDKVIDTSPSAVAEDAHIELQDASGVWRRASTTRADLQVIRRRMEELKASNPTKRV